MNRRRIATRTALVLVLLLSSMGLTSCAQSKIYAGSKKESTFFTLPNGWKKISQNALNAKEAEANNGSGTGTEVLWQEAYSLTGKITPADVFSLRGTPEPVVLGRVRVLSADEANSVSYNQLRDIIVPITTWLNDPTSAPSTFALIDDQERVERNARGIRTVFNYTGKDGVAQVIDETALVSDDRMTIYLLIIRSPADQYQKEKGVLDAIAASFTVKGKP